MASKEWAIKQYGLVNLNGRDHYLDDGDTWVDAENGEVFRGKGFDTAETSHPTSEKTKSPSTFRGYAQTQIVADMMQDKGFDTQTEDGVGHFGRTMGVVSNSETDNTMSNKMHIEGLVDPNQYASKEDMDAFNAGNVTRAALGDEANNGYYGDKRDLLESLKPFDAYTPKTIALNESQYAAEPYLYNDVMFRRFDRTIDNKANSPMATGFASGIDSLQQGYWGVVEMIGNKVNSDYLERVGADNVEANQTIMDEQPIWVNDVSDVNSIASFGDWATGALGGSVHYFMLMAAGFIPGMQIPVGAAMSLTYGGQTWNEMKGANDEKSAFIALTSGIAMAAFERLGGEGVLRGLAPKDLMDEKGIKAAIERLTSPQRDASGKFAKKKLTTKEARQLITDAKEAEMLAVLKQFGENGAIWQAYAKRVGISTATGFGSEAITEGAQEGTQYIGAHLGSEEGTSEFSGEELGGRLLNATLAGGMLGGGIKGAGSAITNTSPIHTGLRDAAWGRMTADNFDETALYEMDEVLDTAGEAHLNRGTAPVKNADGSTTVQSTSDAGKNTEQVGSWVEQGEAEKKEKSTLGRMGEIFTNSEWLSSRYQVLKTKLGAAAKSSKTLLAEMDFSGFIDGRVAAGLKLPQIKRKLQGIQHAGIYNATQGLADALGWGNSHDSRTKAYEMLRKYVTQRGTLDNEYNEANIDKEFLDNKEELEAALRKIRNVESQVFDWVRKAEGDNSSYNPLPYHTLTERHLSVDKVADNKDKFVNILIREYGYSREEAEAEFAKIEGTPEGYDFNSYAQSEFLSKKPVLLKNTIAYENDVFKDFWEENTYESSQVRGTEVANYVADTNAMGFGGEKLNSKIIQIHKELAEAQGKEYADKVIPEIAASIYAQYQAHRGEFHKIKNDKARIALSNLGSLMALAYMPLAVWSSLPEIGLAFLKGDKDMLFKTIERMTKVSAQSMAKQMNNIANTDLSTLEYEASLDVLRRRGMLTHEYGAGHVVDAEYGNDRRNWMQKTLMPAFYRMTGLTSFTSAMRVVRDSIGNDFIAQQVGVLEQVNIKRSTNPDYELNNKEARAFKMMKELGANPLEITANIRKAELIFEKSRAAIDAVGARASLEANKKTNTLSKEQVRALRIQASVTFDSFLNSIDQADITNVKDEKSREMLQLLNRVANELDMVRSNFVDASLVNPDPGKRPLFYSDGRFRLLTLFQGYLSVFSATIIKPILKDLAGQGSPKDQMNAAAMIMTMVGLGFLGQAMKDEIKYGDSPSWLTDAEYLQRGMLASGIMGQTERIFNLFFPLYHSKEDTLADKAWGEIGPLTGTIDSIQKGVHWATEGETERSINKFLKVAPLGVLTQQRKWIAETIAGE